MLPQTAGQQSQPVPELGLLKAAAERVAKVRSDIECFVGRFNGSVKCVGGGVAEVTEDAGCYRNDIRSLFEQVELLEQIAEGLRDIG